MATEGFRELQQMVLAQGRMIAELQAQVAKCVKKPTRPTIHAYIAPDDLKACRIAAGWTQAVLARLLGSHLHSVKCWERGRKRISRKTAERILEVFKYQTRRPQLIPQESK